MAVDQKNKRSKTWIWGVVGLILIVLLGWWWPGRDDGETVPEGDYPTAEVERRSIDVVAEAAGLVEPIRVVEVKSAAGGEVLEVAVDTGDAVPQGLVLARIDPRDVQSSVDQASADLEAAQVRLQTTQSEQRRIERLLQEGLVAENQLDQAVDATANARAAQVRAAAALRLARERSEDVIIRAPTAGTVLDRTVEPGQIIASASSNVSGGTTLFTMADLSVMQARTQVDEVDIGRIRAGQAARVTVEAYPNRAFQGEVIKIEPQAVVEQNVTLFPVLVRLDNAEGLLRPGMNAEVTFRIASRRNVLTVPNSAVVSARDAAATASALGLDPPALEGGRGGGSRGGGFGGGSGGSGGNRGDLGGTGDGEGDQRPAVVFVEGPAGPELRRVTVGLSDWEHTEVVEGVEEGEAVILASVAQLQQRQQELDQRIRSRMGSPLGGGGGSGGRSGGSSGGGRSGGRSGGGGGRSGGGG
jgi:HlyD family secretion protein